MFGFDDIQGLIEEFCVDSDGAYPNSILMTEAQYKKVISDVLTLMDVAEEAWPEIAESITLVCGLKVVFVDYLDSPRVVLL